jgi:hypothetical protein
MSDGRDPEEGRPRTSDRGRRRMSPSPIARCCWAEAGGSVQSRSQSQAHRRVPRCADDQRFADGRKSPPIRLLQVGNHRGSDRLHRCHDDHGQALDVCDTNHSDWSKAPQSVRLLAALLYQECSGKDLMEKARLLRVEDPGTQD